MNSFMGWIGGKKLLRNEITKRMPENISRYVEVCGGAGWVLFAKDKHAELEVYNDMNGNLVNLFRCVKHHCGELQKELSYMLNSRELFQDFAAQYNTRGMTDIQRAARFFMLVKTGYGCKHTTYGCIKRNINHAIEYLDAIQKRLNSVVIENKDFENLIKVYDRPNTLFYVDPPYYGTEKYYQSEFSSEDHIRLKNTLDGVQGKFILSYNECDYIQELYSGYKVEVVNRNHNLRARYEGSDKNYGELLIRNYE